MSKRILIINQNMKFTKLLVYKLSKEGYQAVGAANLNNVEKIIERTNPDMIIGDTDSMSVDWNRICALFTKKSDTKVVLLASEERYEKTLRLGAYATILKPFKISEIVNILENGANDASDEREEVSIGELTVNINEQTVLLNNEKLETTPKEVELLWRLANNPGRAYSREELLKTIWGYEFYCQSRTIDTHIKRLRKKLKNAQGLMIETVWGVGYKFDVKSAK